MDIAIYGMLRCKLIGILNHPFPGLRSCGAQRAGEANPPYCDALRSSVHVHASRPRLKTVRAPRAQFRAQGQPALDYMWTGTAKHQNRKSTHFLK